jgi:hypothetical protein
MRMPPADVCSDSGDDLDPRLVHRHEPLSHLLRKKKVPVEDRNGMLPSVVVEQVSEPLDRPFTMHAHTQAWKYYRVRPPSGARDRFATKSDFCFYNGAFGQ